MQEGQDIQVRDDEDSDEEGAQQQDDGQDSPDRQTPGGGLAESEDLNQFMEDSNKAPVRRQISPDEMIKDVRRIRDFFKTAQFQNSRSTKTQRYFRTRS
ncbi:hypothetical protein FGO68_gene5083 [Halteria grandinella]|uniref:Uncharacterized protein n=1 Tax=Halteria grandinella TaxID=5974 RepID=A0A8J8T346_HALGN|nr:hypothetical protein FGO68_gene5083 [Halteria grandinella]